MSSAAPPPNRKAVDQAIYDLAESFIEDGCHIADIWELAGVIQTACEDACRGVADRPRDDDPNAD